MSAAPISELMTPNPEALDLDDKIAFALHKMDVGHYRHVPLLDDGRVAHIWLQASVGELRSTLVEAQAMRMPNTRLSSK